MLALRSLRRPFGSKVPHLRPLTRWQHDNYGPHKEYFQHPSQYPIDGLPTGPTRVSQPTLNIPTGPPAPPPPPPPPSSTQVRSPSLIQRFFRASLLTVVFLMAGYSVGTGVITWEYLQPPYGAGSEEYQELLQEIEDIIEHHSLVFNLRENGWTEESTRPNAGQSQHLMHNTLSGIQGIPVTRLFRQPDGNASALVFFTGFGVEVWPDVVHGGMLASMFDEVLEQHFKQYPDLKRVMHGNLDIQFMQRVRPGEVYALLVVPQAFRPDSDGISNYLRFFTFTLLFSGDYLPNVESARGPESQDVSELKFELRDATVHAALAASSVLEMSKVVRYKDESEEAYGKRQQQAIDKYCEDFIRRKELQSKAEPLSKPPSD